jgi:hypothetical protein
MTRRIGRQVVTALGVLLGAAVAAHAPAQEAGAKPDQQAMMEAMQRAMQPGENHTLLAALVGEWTYTMKFWMEPGAPPMESTGRGVYTMLLGGRYLRSEADGLVMGQPFHGLGLTGYDNVTRRFVATWIDDMGTGIVYMTGTYDSAAKRFTYLMDEDDPVHPGVKIPVRETLTLTGPDKHVMEWYESRGGKEAKTMEIVYTRSK